MNFPERRLIRWHGLRGFRSETNEIVGMRGFTEDEQRYELEHKDGVWICEAFICDLDGEIGYEPLFREVARDENLFIVIQEAEENALKIYQQSQVDIEDEY